MSEVTSPFSSLSPEDQEFFSAIFRVYEGADLSLEEKERINKATGLNQIIADFIGKNRRSNRYAAEKMKSSFGYPKGYSLKSVGEQEKIIRKFFPMIGTREDDLSMLAARPIPVLLSVGVGWTLIPRWEKVGATYLEATLYVLELLAKERKFKNNCKELLTEQSLRRTERTQKAEKQIADAQSGDILVMATQSGMGHAGESIRCAEERMSHREFCLGIFAVACTLLTHPEREVTRHQLHPECGGDFFLPEEGKIARSAYFSCQNDVLSLDSVFVNDFGDGYGCASGYLL